MNLQNTSRGVEELLYNLGSSLERFKGVNGLQRLVTTGKLSLLSLFGEFERTRDEVYERRSVAVSETRRCLVQIVDEFEGITGATAKLVHKVEHLLGTLEGFHRTCDMELDNGVNDDSADSRQLLRDFQQMRETNAKMKESLNDFCAATTTCADLTRSAVAQLVEVNSATSCDVAMALTEFDRQRRRVQVKENEVTVAMSRAASRQDPAVQFAEFNFLKESEALEGVGKRYIDSLAAAMTSTTFALEQSSMTGWASSNVFFVQLGLLFDEMTDSSKAVAQKLLSVKNSQKVSRQLTDEKRRLLQNQRAAGSPGVALGPHFSSGGFDADVPPVTVAAPRTSNAPSGAAQPVQPLYQSAPQFAPAPAPAPYQPSAASPSGSPNATSRAVDLDDLFQ